ncbi:MAG: MerR family transcriptional regulator [Myxococcaceae bacterium]
MSSEPTYRINVAAEMSGVSENLIRAWERRYGVPRPVRTSSGYRAYARSEIELLRRLKQLTERGVSIKEAAAMVPALTREVKSALAEESKGPSHGALQYPEWRDALLRDAQRFDQQAVEAALDRAMAARPPLGFFEEFVSPLLHEVGDRWHAGTLSVGEEHLVSNAIRERLLSLVGNAPRRAKHHVVCACLPSEEHELGLLGAALRFRHAGWRVTYLGARTPLRQLANVVRTLKPDLIALSAVRDGRELKGLDKLLPAGTRVVVGGAAARSVNHRYPVIDRAEDWPRFFEELS